MKRPKASDTKVKKPLSSERQGVEKVIKRKRSKKKKARPDQGELPYQVASDTEDSSSKGHKPTEMEPHVSKSTRKREKFHNSKNSSLREKMISRLSAARFRYINEELYKWDGQDATVFSSDPKSFSAYHSGFKQQTKLWPVNPVDLVIKSIKKIPDCPAKVIADFGCGEAKIAHELPSSRVYSFDLVALNDKVTVCDNAKTTLFSGSVDIAVHCLSLMSANISGYIKEANRVLKTGGVLKIAEVESRFKDVDEFVKNICKFNFKLLKKDLSHNLFYFMDFEKVGNIGVARKRKLPAISLLPCLYKKR